MSPKKKSSSRPASAKQSRSGKSSKALTPASSKDVKSASSSKQVSIENSIPEENPKVKEEQKESKQTNKKAEKDKSKKKEVRVLQHQKETIEEPAPEEIDSIGDLSNLDKDNYTEQVSASEHNKMLENNIKTETAKGNMLSKTNFKLLHYEDPRIVELKMTDVSVFIYFKLSYK